MSISQPQSQELDTLVKITEILAGPRQFLEKCATVVEVLADFTNSELVTLRELDPENFTLSLVTSCNRLLPTEDTHIHIPVSDSLSAEALRVQAPVVVNDYLALETRHQGYVDSGVRSGLALPVQVDGENLGTLAFASKSLDHYEDDTVRVLVAIGAVVGMMIVKAELQEDNEVEGKVGRIVSSPLDGLGVFERFAAEAGRIIEFDRLALNSVNLEENTYFTEFVFGDQVPNFPIGKIQKINGTALEIVVQTKNGHRFLLDERDGVKPRFPNAESAVASGKRYFIGVPLIVGDQVIGTMGLHRSSRHFSHKDLTKAQRLASLAAGAFADFKLAKYKTQTEQKNSAILTAETNIGRLLISSIARSNAFETVKSELSNIIPVDQLVLTSVDLEAETFCQDFTEFLNNPELVAPDDPAQSYAGSIIGEVIRSGHGQIIDSDDPRLAAGQLPLSQQVFDQGYRSTMAVPLKFEDLIIGTAHFSRFDGEYCDDDMATAERMGIFLAGALATFKLTAERNRAQSALTDCDSRLERLQMASAAVFGLPAWTPTG